MYICTEYSARMASNGFSQSAYGRNPPPILWKLEHSKDVYLVFFFLRETIETTSSLRDAFLVGSS